MAEMKDQHKTDERLIDELTQLRRRVPELEALEAEREKAEEALRESEARTRSILNTTVDGIITITERGIVESLNPAAERIFGYCAAEVIGQNVKMLMPEPYRSEHDGYIGNYTRTGEAKIIGIGREAVGRRKDGSTFPMDLAVSATRLDRQCLFTGVVRDITELNELDARVLKGLTIFAQSLKLISNQVSETEDAFIYTIEALARAAEASDEDTGRHIARVNEYSKCLADELGLDAQFVRKIHYSAQMHDVGKIYLHPSLLGKPGSLTVEESAQMTQHTIHGAKILGDAPRLEMARQIALAHHEKYDGSGYPFGLKGEAIPLAARIVSVADVYDALRQK